MAFEIAVRAGDAVARGKVAEMRPKELIARTDRELRAHREIDGDDRILPNCRADASDRGLAPMLRSCSAGATRTAPERLGPLQRERPNQARAPGTGRTGRRGYR